MMRTLPTVMAGVCALQVAAAPLLADDVIARVRTSAAEVRRLIDEATARSATIRSLVAEIDRSDLIVYVRVRTFASTRLDGRIGFLSKNGGRRFLVIELACPRSPALQIATLAHELYHAVEIAGAPWVDGPASLAKYYGQIGLRTDSGGDGWSFETRAAAEVGARVRRELLTVATDER